MPMSQKGRSSIDQPITLSTEPMRLTWQQRLLVFAGWTLVGLFYAFRLYILYVTDDGVRLISWQQSVVWGLADWYLWGALSPLIYKLATRITLDSRRWLTATVTHIVASFGFALLQLFLFSVMYRPLGSYFYHQVGTSANTFWEQYENLVAGKFHIAVLTYFLIAMISYAFQFYRNYREEQEQRARMEARLAQAQLDALKMQLHPHFLFNTLNSITALIHSDPHAADRMTARLGELLRITLDNEGVHEVPLRIELDFTEKYLDIQRIRFQDRLTVNIDMPPDIHDALVPNLILQPLVENAIQHGIADQVGPGQIEISLRRADQTLVIEVTDNGRGLTQQATGKSGVGLANTRDRLAQLYGDRQSLELTEPPDGGLRVAITLPYHTGPVQDPLS